MATRSRRRSDQDNNSLPILALGGGLFGLGLWVMSRNGNGNGNGGNGTVNPVIIQQPRGSLSLQATTSPIRFHARAWTDATRTVEVTSQIQWWIESGGVFTNIGFGALTDPDLPGFSVKRIVFSTPGLYAVEARLGTARDRTIVEVAPSNGGGNGGGNGAPVISLWPEGEVTIPVGSTLRAYSQAFEDASQQVNISSQITFHTTDSTGAWHNLGFGSLNEPDLLGFSVKRIVPGSRGRFSLIEKSIKH